jgi:hypothetical protein
MTTATKTDAQPLKVLSGLNGQLEVYPDRLVIRRKWGLSRLPFAEQEKTIYPHQIADINCFEGRFLINGSLRITLKEGNQHTLWFAFNQKHACEAREVRKLIDDFISKNAPHPPHE